MKQLFTYFLFALLLIASGCEDDRAPSGIDAYVYWGECDSMQTFSEYNGIVYFVPASRFNEVTDSTWDSLKVSFNSSMCTDGFMSNFFDPGDYIAEPDTFINTLPPEIITVEPDLLKEVEIRFIYCR